VKPGFRACNGVVPPQIQEKNQMFQLAIRHKVSYFVLAAAVTLLLAAPIATAPVLADCSSGSSGSCVGPR
jgi:hypothetical protein